MIYTDERIREEMDKGNIVIHPFQRKSLGTNSYDVHLGKTLGVYTDNVLDFKNETAVSHIEIPKEGYTLVPGELYLAVTQEYTETRGAVPIIEGKSSVARYGVSIHQTAGFGDDGFCGFWTLEMTVVKPVIVYPGMPIAQLVYHKSDGVPTVAYNLKATAKYNNIDYVPIGSRMFKNNLDLHTFPDRVVDYKNSLLDKAGLSHNVLQKDVNDMEKAIINKVKYVVELLQEQFPYTDADELIDILNVHESLHPLWK